MNISDGEKIYRLLEGKEIKSPYLENTQFLKDLVNLKLQAKDFEAPDLLFISDDLIYAIEHFAVTSTKTIERKWSSLEQVYNQRVKRNNAESLNKDLETKDFASIEVENIPESNYKFLVENIKNSFDNHYKNIESYKQNISNKYPDKDIKVIFFIEYKYVLPFWFIKRSNNNVIKWFYPHKDTNLLNYFSNKVLLEGVIFNYSVGGYERRNLFLPILDKYEADNEDLFDTKEGIIESIPPNIRNIGIRIPNNL